MATNPNTPHAARTTVTAEKNRDTLARFIVDEILNAPGESDSELREAARKALTDAGYTVYEEIRRD